jgi:hypothetical protein
MDPFAWFRKATKRVPAEELCQSVEVTARVTFAKPLPHSIAKAIAHRLGERVVAAFPTGQPLEFSDPRMPEGVSELGSLAITQTVTFAE